MAHKVFVSYHHDKDQHQADHLKKYYDANDTIWDCSLPKAFDKMSNDDILCHIRHDYLKESTVTIVLIGAETASRKWIDWEIYASLRTYHGSFKRNGLLGIYLPSAGNAPQRLQDNIDSQYAVTMDWKNISWQLASKVEEAFNNREKDNLVKNGRPRKQHNGWSLT